MATASPDPQPGAPLTDPFARPAPGRGAEPRRPAPPSKAWILPLSIALCLGAVAAVLFALRAFLTPPPAPPPSVITVRSTPNVLIAVKELSRLETAEVHVEKVIDLTDTQSRMFGLVEATDALLLVAVGQATLGVDLGKLGDTDVTMDPLTKTARLRLPPIELLSVGLDEKSTYVYTRSTSLLARRNEQLESQARREAVEVIKKAAADPDRVARAKTQAEKQLRALVTQLGAERVEITWRE